MVRGYTLGYTFRSSLEMSREAIIKCPFSEAYFLITESAKQIKAGVPPMCRGLLTPVCLEDCDVAEMTILDPQVMVELVPRPLEDDEIPW